jgi:hypothetical protein
MVVVDEVFHADQEHVYRPRPFHRKVLGVVPGKMETKLTVSFCTVSFFFQTAETMEQSISQYAFLKNSSL